MDGWMGTEHSMLQERKKERYLFIYSPYNQRYYLDGVRGSVRLGWLDSPRGIR